MPRLPALPCLATLLAVGCGGERPEQRGLPAPGVDMSRPSVSILPITVRDSIASVRGVTVRNGGFGSAISRGPEGQLYLLTDRGPNYDFAEETKAFAAPEVGPQVGVFERRATEITLLRRIPLRNIYWSPTNGLPNPPGPETTAEAADSPGGHRLEPDPHRSEEHTSELQSPCKLVCR